MIILPYKETTDTFLGPKIIIKRAIYEDIGMIFNGLWTHVTFLFVLLPSVLLIQIRRSPLTVYKKVLLLLEGIIALLAAFVMFIFMTLQFDVLALEWILTPVYYLSLSWVILGVIASILLTKKKMYDKAAKLLSSE
jgi:hypothetical protein